jgi:hypothetical protein
MPSTLSLAAPLSRPREGGMAEYRAFPVGNDGRFIGFEPLFCESDDEAVATAKRLAQGHDAELWCGPRLVARLKRETCARHPRLTEFS